VEIDVVKVDITGYSSTVTANAMHSSAVPKYCQYWPAPR